MSDPFIQQPTSYSSSNTFTYQPYVSLAKPLREALFNRLSSMKFRKIRGRLRKGENCYCIQGAMCEAYRQEIGKGEWTKDDAFKLNSRVFISGAPIEVLAAFGLSSECARLLMNENDTRPTRMRELIRKARRFGLGK